MRKYILPGLGLYLDFIVIDAGMGLAAFFLATAIEGWTGMPVTWPMQISASLLGVVLLRYLDRSIGEWLLAHAMAERAAGVTTRQWPNLVMGTIGVLSGLKEMVRWTAPGDQMPFLFMVEETPLKIFAITTYGAAFVLGGVLLLRFAPGARLFNAVLIALGAAMLAINLAFYHDAMVAAQITRRINQGLPVDPAAAEAVVASAPLYSFGLFALLFVLVYLCREGRQTPRAALAE